MSNDVVVFGPFRLLPAQQILLENDKPVRVGSRALAILIHLIAHAGDVVSKDQIFAHVWPGIFVDEANLRVHIAALRRALGDGQAGKRYLTTIPGRGYSFVADLSRTASGTDVNAARVIAPQTPHLPISLTRTLGRFETIAALQTQLKSRRFLTIVGPGGIGKTTVALAVAEALEPSFQHGVRFVDFAPLADPKLVPNAFASALGLPIRSKDPIPDLMAFIHDKQMLLVLDGCEHVLSEAAILAEAILKNASGTRILTTSREPMRAEGEHVHRLLPLAVPPFTDDLTAAEAFSFPAVQLFVERAAASLDSFELNDVDAPVVAEICRKLDGIALAIELAAGRISTLGLRGIATNLDDRFKLLTQGRRTSLPRHQALVATLNWSYALLDESERIVFRRLGVFAGSFTPDCARAVTSGNGINTTDVVDIVADLVAKSLVSVDVGGAVVRYRLLDTMRAYAIQKLQEHHELELFTRRHAEYFRDFFAQAETELEKRTSENWLATYGPQIDNVRGALEWAFGPQGDSAIGVGLTISAVPLWLQSSLMEECCSSVERAVAAVPRGPAGDLRQNMKLYAAYGNALPVRGPGQPATDEAHQKALMLAEQLGDADYQLRSLRGLWAGKLNTGRIEEAYDLARKFAEVALISSNPDDRLVADRMIGYSLHLKGDQAQARHYTQRVLDHYVEPVHNAPIIRFQYDQLVTTQITYAHILWLQGNVDEALAIARRNVNFAEKLGHAVSLCFALGQAAVPIALLNGDLAAAREFNDMMREQSIKHALGNWQKWAACFDVMIGIAQSPKQMASAEITQAIKNLPIRISNLRFSASMTQLAQALFDVGKTATALEVIESGLDPSGTHQERWYVPDLLRLKGEVALARQDPMQAEALFQESLVWARKQSALSYELRTATSLARFLIIQNRKSEAQALLGGVYDRFSEGFETHDLKVAKAILAGLQASFL